MDYLFIMEFILFLTCFPITEKQVPKKCSCVVAARRAEDYYETCPRYLKYGPKFQKEVKKAVYAHDGFKFLIEGDKEMIKSRTFQNDEEAEEYYKADKKYLDKVVYEEKKKYELHPLGDNYYHPQFEDDDSGEEWRQSQEELYFIYDWFQSRIFTRIKSKLVLIYHHSQSFYIILSYIGTY